MTFDEIIAGIDRHFRLREEGRRRRHADALSAGGTPGVSFEWTWPRDTDLTREQIEIAMRDESAASPSQPEAGRTVETTAHHAPPPQQWQPGPTPVLGGIMGEVDDGWTKVSSDGPRVFGEGVTGAAAMLDYAESRGKAPAVEGGCWPTMPMREMSNDNYDRRWIAQGDDVEAIGIGDTPQEASIEYARAVADLLRPARNPDALDSKAAIRRQLAACRGECGDGPPDYSEWPR